MESWHKRILLGAALAAAAVSASAQDPIEVVEPDLDRREVQSPAIDTEDFEIGIFAGVLSVTDFASEPVYGLRAAWHISESFFFEGNYGTSEVDLTSYEKLSGGAPLFEDEERDYTFYNLAVGWNFLPGEIYFSESRAFKSDMYLLGGVGGTDFLGDNWFTATVGVGYRLLFNDSFAARMDVRDHIFDRDVFGEDETTHNIEWTLGVTYFF
ncbi:outer membrane beta-barrel domain-containing protein [Halioglobus maricola]|uniref:Outer membrane beta-barrel domain-containing protein n=1 Tax=Halioglobus maricola TaxID=2601894 RepID=A0A5P9NPL5_9GAMM|nr:outer membrane beta-barrel domain-containing protein [Halioglobus maricola]QFU77224.1 outer membrane beta-barrel domain-containing protein [Halioglobus maricola]